MIEDCPLRCSDPGLKFTDEVVVKVVDVKPPGVGEWVLVIEWSWRSKITGMETKNQQFFREAGAVPFRPRTEAPLSLLSGNVELGFADWVLPGRTVRITLEFYADSIGEVTRRSPGAAWG